MDDLRSFKWFHRDCPADGRMAVIVRKPDHPSVVELTAHILDVCYPVEFSPSVGMLFDPSLN